MLISNIKLIFITLSVFLFSIHSFAQTFTSAESAEYDAANDRWLVSNGNIIAVAPNGTLSFFGSASGSYGLEILNNTLFAVGQGGSIKGYDLDTTEEVMSITISGAGFLNGLTNDGINKLYVTDFGNNKIIEVDVSDLNNPVATIIVEDTETQPNGILYESSTNRLLYTSWQSTNAPIKAVDLNDFSITTITNTTVGNIDGIARDGDGNYFISSWSPDRITEYDSNFENAVVITLPFVDRPADIGYAQEKDVIGIPMGDEVIFVDMSLPSSVSDFSTAVYQFNIFPNPFQDHSLLQFHLPSNEEIQLMIYDHLGKINSTLLSGQQPVGWHKVTFAGHSLSPGQYYAVLTTKKGTSTVPFVINK